MAMTDRHRRRMAAIAVVMASLGLSSTAALAGDGASLTPGEAFDGDGAGVRPVPAGELDRLRGGALFSPSFFSNIINATGGQNSVTVAQDGQFEQQSGMDSISITLMSSTQTSTGTVTTTSSTTTSSQSQ